MNSKLSTDLDVDLSALKLSETAYTNYAVIFSILFLLLFSPLVSYMLCITTFWLRGRHLDKLGKYALMLIFALAYAGIVSSSAFGVESSDDFFNYYEHYKTIAKNPEDYFYVSSHYFMGFEAAFPLFFLLLGSLLPLLTPQQLMFLMSFSVSILFSLWVIKQERLDLDSKKNHSFVCAMSLALLSLTVGSQLVRQGISSVILLFAITSDKAIARYLLLLISSAFHVSAIPLFMIARIALTYKWRSLLLFAPLLLGLFFFNREILYPLRNVPKLNVEATASEFFISDIDIGTMKWLSFTVFFFLLAILIPKRNIRKYSDGPHDWTALWCLFLLLFFAFIQYPMVPTRVTLLVSSVMLGYLLAQFLEMSQVRYLKSLVLISVLSIKLLSLIPDSNQSTRHYWFQYDWIGFFPGYYFF